MNKSNSLKKTVSSLFLATILFQVGGALPAHAKMSTNNNIVQSQKVNTTNYLKNPNLNIEEDTKKVAHWSYYQGIFHMPLAFDHKDDKGYYTFDKDYARHSLKSSGNGFALKTERLSNEEKYSFTGLTQDLSFLEAGKSYRIVLTGVAQTDNATGAIYYPFKGSNLSKNIQWKKGEALTVSIDFKATSGTMKINLLQRTPEKIGDITEVHYSNFLIEEVGTNTEGYENLEKATQSVEDLYQDDRHRDLHLDLEESKIETARKLVSQLQASLEKEKLEKLLVQASDLFKAQQMALSLFIDPLKAEEEFTQLQTDLTDKKIMKVRDEVEALTWPYLNTQLVGIVDIARNLWWEQESDREIRTIVEALFENNNFDKLAPHIIQEDLDEAKAILRAVTQPGEKEKLSQLVDKAQELFNQSQKLSMT